MGAGNPGTCARRRWNKPGRPFGLSDLVSCHDDKPNAGTIERAAREQTRRLQPIHTALRMHGQPTCCVVAGTGVLALAAELAWRCGKAAVVETEPVTLCRSSECLPRERG